MYDSPHHPIGFSPLLWKIAEYFNIIILIAAVGQNNFKHKKNFRKNK